MSWDPDIRAIYKIALPQSLSTKVDGYNPRLGVLSSSLANSTALQSLNNC
jgi:hypothetical protein